MLEGTYPVARARSCEKRGSASSSSTTSGWRVTSANPAMPVLDGKRAPSSSPSPRPETASNTSWSLSSSSRKIDAASAPKIARATSTIDWRSPR
jgi:hypothetical protein